MARPSSPFNSPPNNAPEAIRVQAILTKRAMGYELTSGEQSLLIDHDAYIARQGLLDVFVQEQAATPQGQARAHREKK